MKAPLESQTTLAGEIALEGVGVHSGKPTRLRLLPAAAGTGLRFRRVDLPGAPEVPATLDYVLTNRLDRRTTIGLDETVSVATVEHFLAACLAIGLDNVVAEVDAEELPFFDGSAEPLARACLDRGLIELDRPRLYYNVDRPFVFDRAPVQMAALPSENLRVSYFVEFDSEVVPRQAGHFKITRKSFMKKLAPARTFCFQRDIERLQAAGLIRGGSLECAVVIGEDRILNDSLRFPDEIVRHKVIDLLGDLCLLGRPLRAHVTAWRAGHVWHIEFLRHLKEVALR